MFYFAGRYMSFVWNPEEAFTHLTALVKSLKTRVEIEMTILASECFHRFGRHRRTRSQDLALLGRIGKNSPAAPRQCSWKSDGRKLHMMQSQDWPADAEPNRMLFFTVPRPSYEEIAMELAVAKGSIGFKRMQCFERLRRDLEERGSR